MAELALLIGPGQPLYIIIFSAMIIFFCFFIPRWCLIRVTWQNLKRSVHLFPAFAPGADSKVHCGVITRLLMFGAVYITLVCLLPNHADARGCALQLGGTALLISVG